MITTQPDTDEEGLLRKIVDVIVRERSPQAVILFGSRARGDAQADSDVDLLISDAIAQYFLPTAFPGS